MNLGELRGLVREYLNEPVAVFWTDAALNDYVNVGVRKCHALIKSLSRYHFTTRVTFQTVSGTEYYNLPNNLKDLRLATTVTAEGTEVPLLQMYMPNPFPWAPNLSITPDASATIPTHFMVVGKTVRLTPISQGVHTVRLYYEARLVDLVADSDVPTFEEDYHDMAAKWAAIEARIKDRQPSDDILAIFNERKNDLILDLFHRLPHPYTEVEGYLQSDAWLTY